MTPEQFKELGAEHYDEWTHLDSDGYSFEATIRMSEGVEYSLRTRRCTTTPRSFAPSLRRTDRR